MELNKPDSPDEEPISLVGEEDETVSLTPSVGTAKPSGVRAFGSGAVKLDQKIQFKRPLNKTATGATRCKVFYSKIAVASLVHMEHQINEWIDIEELDIKHVVQTVGVMEGKSAEANLIVTVWY